jgi:dolichyl-phosphate-mannose-protein mannosyltransferase
VLVNYAANWLPWALVQRCTFLYHALGLVPFGVLALAWLLSRWLVEEIFLSRVMALMLILAIILGFWFWLPVFIGLPLSPEALQHRWWLRSWI